jgi:hypothetical protein
MPETTSTRNSGEDWTEEDLQKLRELAEGNTPTGVISLKLGRSEEAVRAKAQAEVISPAPASLRSRRPGPGSRRLARMVQLPRTRPDRRWPLGCGEVASPGYVVPRGAGRGANSWKLMVEFECGAGVRVSKSAARGRMRR